MILELAKEFARNGYFVFPTYKSKASNFAKPYGWTGTAVREEAKQALAIPASTHELDIDTWEEQLKSKYKAEISGYGIIGRGIFIFDIDIKDGKGGYNNFNKLRDAFNIPPASIIARSKSGGYHLFFARPKKFKNSHVKSVANALVAGIKYDGVDVRGDGGYVQGATRKGEWEEGTYTIIKGSPNEPLTELPEELIQHFIISSFGSDLDAMTSMSNYTKSDDLSSILRRGELPKIVPEGARNESFFIFLNAMKAKGLDREMAKQMALQLKDRCENKETLHESVDIDAMIDRIFEKSTDNPYDIAIDMVQRGLYQLMNYKSRVMYIMPCDNPYIMSKSAHDLSSMREMLSKYQCGVTGSDGKTRQVNPIDVALRRIPDIQKADTIGYKPGSPDVFTLNDDATGKRYLNMYCKPFIPATSAKLDMSVFEKDFKFLISRIFGREGTQEYQLGLDFCAWFLQYPELKCVIAPYVMSKNRGVGKSLLLNLLTRLHGMSRVGERQAKILKLDDLAGRFFDPTGVVLNVIDEVQFAVHRNMRQETSVFWRHLKNLITADTIPVEIKGGGIFQVPNTAGLILAGNKGGHFPIEELDRRVWIIDNDPPLLERGVIDRLFDVVIKSGTAENSAERQGYVEALRFGLQHHKIETALDSVRAPMNELKLEMMKNTMTDIEEWLFDFFGDPNNMMAETPVITRSMFVYMLQVSDQVHDDKWRDEAEAIFRDAKRRGQFQAIKSNNVTLNFPSIPHVNRNGDIIMSDRKESLFTTRDHGAFDNMPQDRIKHALFRNLHSISKWKKDSIVRTRTSMVNIDDVINELKA